MPLPAKSSSLCSAMARAGFIFLILSAILCYMTLWKVSFLPNVHTLVHPTTGPQFHLVISHHSEDPRLMRSWTEQIRAIPYIKSLGIKIIVYTKNPQADLEEIEDEVGAEEVIQLPNVGRESATYLHHLLEVHDDPPKFIMFIQAGPVGLNKSHLFDHWQLDALTDKLDHDVKFLNLNPAAACHCGNCDKGFFPLIPQIYAMLEGQICHESGEGQVIAWNGQFVVSRNRIIARPLGIYQYLHDLVTAADDHWIHREKFPDLSEIGMRTSTPRNPKFGHTMERLWPTIFNCTSPTAEGCQYAWK